MGVTWIVAVLVAGAAWGLIATHLNARRHRWRWGTRATPFHVAAGPYRSFAAEIHSPRPIPARVAAASLLSPAWGLLIGLVFAPAGLLFAVLLLDAGRISAALMMVAITGLCLHGFGLAAALAAAPAALYERRADRLARLARHVLVHHSLVLVAFGGIATFFGYRELLIAAAPAGLGLLLGWLLAGAAKAAGAPPPAPAMLS